MYKAEQQRADTELMDILKDILGLLYSSVECVLDPAWIKFGLEVQDIVWARSEVPEGPIRSVFGMPADVVEFLGRRTRFVIELLKCLRQDNKLPPAAGAEVNKADYSYYSP